MKSIVVLSLLVLTSQAALASREGAYRCENRHQEILIEVNVSRDTNGDLDLWFSEQDEDYSLVDYQWIGRDDLDVEVRTRSGQIYGLRCSRR